MESQLGTSNLFLGIIAAMSVLQILLVIGAGIGMLTIYRRSQRAYLHVIDLVAMAEERHVVPTMMRVNAILDDVQDVTSAVRTTVDRVDHTAERVRSNVLAKTSRIVGFVRSARTVIEMILNSRAA